MTSEDLEDIQMRIEEVIEELRQYGQYDDIRSLLTEASLITESHKQETN